MQAKDDARKSIERTTPEEGEDIYVGEDDTLEGDIQDETSEKSGHESSRASEDGSSGPDGMIRHAEEDRYIWRPGPYTPGPGEIDAWAIPNPNLSEAIQAVPTGGQTTQAARFNIRTPTSPRFDWDEGQQDQAEEG